MHGDTASDLAHITNYVSRNVLEEPWKEYLLASSAAAVCIKWLD